MQVRKQLGDRFGRDVFFNSITLMPEQDSPEVLKRYAAPTKALDGIVVRLDLPPESAAD